jgi:protein-L-isoaspartate(D-aspartate) O-methyltransferase
MLRTANFYMVVLQVPLAPLVNLVSQWLRPTMQDRPLPNGPSETISAPHMHAIALELLSDRLQPGNRVLDVGSGSGYLTACFAHTVQPGGYVLGIEKYSTLVETSLEYLAASVAKPWLEEGSLVIRHGNILGSVQLPSFVLMRYCLMHVSAAACQ